MTLHATLISTRATPSLIANAPRRSSRLTQAERLVVMVREGRSVLVVGCCLAPPWLHLPAD